jgi:hypothetical protein
MDPLTLIAAVDASIIVVNKLVAMAQASRARGEWTPEQEAEFEAKIATLRQAEHWQTDAQRTAAAGAGNAS